MGEPIRFWLVYRVACPYDANRWSCFADEVNARSICATANKAWGDGTWAVREATLGDDAAAYHRGLTDAAGLCEQQSDHYAKCSAQERGRDNDELADGLDHASAGALMCRQVIETELDAIRRAAGGQ